MPPQTWCDELYREREELEREVERLRTALKAIVDKGQKGDYMERAPLVSIALEALHSQTLPK